MLALFLLPVAGTRFAHSHPAQEIARLLLDLRGAGLSPAAIANHFAREYDLLLYAGDVFSYIDEAIHGLEAVERIASAVGKGAVAERARALIRSLEG
jgi:helicase